MEGKSLDFREIWVGELFLAQIIYNTLEVARTMLSYSIFDQDNKPQTSLKEKDISPPTALPPKKPK